MLDHARTAAALGADALVATAPFYTRTHPREIAAHFRHLRTAVDLPLFAYDIPVAVHSKLPPSLVRELAEDGTLAGLKDSSGDEGSLRRLIVGLGGRTARHTGPAPGFAVLTGSELTVDAALLAGADGVVPGIGNVDPAGYVRLYEAARSGDWERAAAEQERLVGLFAMVDAGPEAEMGRSSSRTRRVQGGAPSPRRDRRGHHRLPAAPAERRGRGRGRTSAVRRRSAARPVEVPGRPGRQRAGQRSRTGLPTAPRRSRTVPAVRPTSRMGDARGNGNRRVPSWGRMPGHGCRTGRPAA